MIRKSATAAWLAALAALTACSSGQPAAAPSSPAAPPASTAAPAASTGTSVPGVTLSGERLPPGPFKITPVYCGRFTAAERNTYGTNARGGLIYKYANVSNSVTGAAIVSVNFTDGSTVTGNNVAGSPPQIGPGQSASGEVDAVGGAGVNLTFTGCELMSYTPQTSSGDQPVSYAP